MAKLISLKASGSSPKKKWFTAKLSMVSERNGGVPEGNDSAARHQAAPLDSTTWTLGLPVIELQSS
ncbi:MAG: hypothetical protein IPK54_04520 [Dokdonella sp.]|uniref:hypothetical protein n=1 Tax=Dokdonella sp. TaxID=2291710 RepID=UPI0025C62C8A|nr:hypothetical protein [Dokdonella sp.]MBK8122816.1 hypothetical protein [Dokdonella sp.]